MSGTLIVGTGVPATGQPDIYGQYEANARSMNRHTKNQAEFKVMYDQHFDSVARYCLRRLPDPIAHDAVSDVFLTAWRRFDSVPPGEASLPWLYGIARNVVRNTNRSQRRSTRLSARFNAEPHYPEPSPELQVVRNEQDTSVLLALEQLKPDDQEVLRLRAYEDLSVKEISVALGCSEAAAKKRVSRSLKRLRNVWPTDHPVPSGTYPRATQQGGEQ